MDTYEIDAPVSTTDTEGSVVTERVVDIASATIHNLSRQAGRGPNEQARTAAAAALSVETMLRRVHYVRARSLTEQQAALRMLPSFVAQHPQVGFCSVLFLDVVLLVLDVVLLLLDVVLLLLDVVLLLLDVVLLLLDVVLLLLLFYL